MVRCSTTHWRHGPSPVGELERGICIHSCVTSSFPHAYPADSGQSRAERLKTQANNCVMLAVTERSVTFAAELIDEAVKLSQRADELSRDGVG